MHQSGIWELFGNVKARLRVFLRCVFLNVLKLLFCVMQNPHCRSEYFAVVSTTTVMTSKMSQCLALREVWGNQSHTILIAGEKRRFHQFTKRKFSPLCPLLRIHTEHRRQQSCVMLCRTPDDTV